MVDDPEDLLALADELAATAAQLSGEKNASTVSLPFCSLNACREK